MQLTILGNNSALSNHNRFPTAQTLHIGNELFLVDCGEGTQVRLIKHKIKYSRISRIFISHLHGDHYYGLIGLLTRYGLNNRTEPLHIYGPRRLLDIINLQREVSCSNFPYELIFHPIDGDEANVIYENANIRVTKFPTIHRIPCYGFKFEEIDPFRKLNLQAIQALNIPYTDYQLLQAGGDYTDELGHVIPNKTLTSAPNPIKSYAYCADTRYTEQFLETVRGVDLLYHETTYLKDQGSLAFERFHSTTEEAATLATKAQVKQLIIGHFSSKYSELSQFLEESQAIFHNTILSAEGMVIEIQ